MLAAEAFDLHYGGSYRRAVFLLVVSFLGLVEPTPGGHSFGPYHYLNFWFLKTLYITVSTTANVPPLEFLNS